MIIQPGMHPGETTKPAARPELRPGLRFAAEWNYGIFMFKVSVARGGR